MQPRSDGAQRCLSFQLKIHPRARVHSYRDYLGNTVHHFDVPGKHRQLTLAAEALVDVQPPLALPDALPADAWSGLAALISEGDFNEMIMPSQFAQPTDTLEQFASDLDFPALGDARRHYDPLTLLLRLNEAVHSAIAYVPKSTLVDSPIDHALESRQGVCQDFAHIMIAMARRIGIPCRYVSGYLFHRDTDARRSPEGATHAWVEALLPEIGWVGFDPTNNVLAGERHIRTSVGRDYSDVPPTKGVFKGAVESQLIVAVSVAPSDTPPLFEPELARDDAWASTVREDATDAETLAQQQQQQ